MKRYWVLMVIVVMVVAVVAIVRFLPPDRIVIEKSENDRSVQIFDTIKVIETAGKKHFKAKRIELNSADSALLVSVYGIGTIFQKRIVDYRQRLGGFYRKEQLREVRGISDEVYHKIEPNFWVDTLVIKKINLNFATPKQLEAHPYFTKSMIARLEKSAQMKGGYATLRQLIDNDILLPREATKIAPYVCFE